jgi:hypothetical protein
LTLDSHGSAVVAADEFPETDELVAAVDEGIRSAQSGQSLSIEEAKELIRNSFTPIKS